jgi:hypothetical protein
MGERFRFYVSSKGTDMGEGVYFVVRSGHGGLTGEGIFTDVIGWAIRVPRQHNRWQSVTWERRRYQLHGGIRTSHFICTNNPIPRRLTCPGK